MNSNFPIAVSFVYGSDDWTRIVDRDYAKECIVANKHVDSQFFVVPDSDHNMHMDNPQALANTIINALLDLNLPVLTLKEQEIEFKEYIKNAEPGKELTLE